MRTITHLRMDLKDQILGSQRLESSKTSSDDDYNVYDSKYT